MKEAPDFRIPKGVTSVFFTVRPRVCSCICLAAPFDKELLQPSQAGIYCRLSGSGMADESVIPLVGEWHSGFVCVGLGWVTLESFCGEWQKNGTQKMKQKDGRSTCVERVCEGRCIDSIKKKFDFGERVSAIANSKNVTNVHFSSLFDVACVFSSQIQPYGHLMSCPT